MGNAKVHVGAIDGEPSANSFLLVTTVFNSLYSAAFHRVLERGIPALIDAVDNDQIAVNRAEKVSELSAEEQQKFVEQLNCDPEDLPEEVINQKAETTILRDLRKGKEPAADAPASQVRKARHRLFFEAENLLLTCLNSIESESDPSLVVEFMNLSTTCEKIVSFARRK